jgi:hypothetical protein
VPTRWLAEEGRPWVGEPVLKPSIAPFYGTDFGSFENIPWSRDGEGPEKQIEHRGDDNEQYVQLDLYII